MKRVLITNPIMLRDLEQFRPLLEQAGIAPEPRAVRQFLTEAELLELIPDFDGTVAGDDQYSARVLEAAAPRLKVISKWGSGVDSIDLEAAKRLGIQVFNSPGAFQDSVADVALGYMLMLERGLHLVHGAVRRGEWPKPEGRTLRGQMLGVVGFGAIGQGVGTRALGFGMTVLANDVRMDELTAPPHVSFCPLPELLATSDWVCLCCNLTPDNRGMINAQSLASMKPSARLVNVARGQLVNEPALLAALSDGRLAGAALDVFDTEPLPRDHPLAKLDNVVLGSHNANNTISANDHVNRNSLRNLLRGFGLEIPLELAEQ